MIFRDRKEGGEQLGKALDRYRDQNALVLGIPRGGVETAYYVAKHLNAQLSLVIARKLGYPFNPEAAFGAVAEDGSLFLFQEAAHELSQDDIRKVVDKEQKEIQRRIARLRKGMPLPGIEGRTVILVDDGIATGATLFAAIMLCENQGAQKIIVAAPIAGDRMEQTLKKMVDEVVILSTPPFYYAVSQGYHRFGDLSDEEVLNIMERWEKERSVNSI